LSCCLPIDARDFTFDINSETIERELYPSEEYHAGRRTGRLPLKSIRSCGSILRLFRRRAPIERKRGNNWNLMEEWFRQAPANDDPHLMLSGIIA